MIEEQMNITNLSTDNTSSAPSRRSLAFRSLLFVSFLALCACEESGNASTGGGTESGSAVVEGNVQSSELADGIDGIEVRVLANRTQTDVDGGFRLAGVPAGNQILVFSKGGQSASLSIMVPAAGTIKLLDVRITGDTVATPAARPANSTSASSEPVTRDYEDDDDGDEEEDEREDESRDTDD